MLMAPLSPATSFLFLKPQITSFALFNGVSAFCCALSHLKLLFASLSVSSTCFFSFLPKVSLCLSCRESGSVVAGWKLLIRLQSAQGCFFWPPNGPRAWEESWFKESLEKVTSCLVSQSLRNELLLNFQTLKPYHPETEHHGSK